MASKWWNGWPIFCINLNESLGTQIFGLNIILSVSVRICVDEINVWINRLSKGDWPSPMWMETTFNSLMTWAEKTGWGRENLLCLSTFELEHCSPTFRLGLELEHMPSALSFLRPSDLDWNHTASSPESPAFLVLNFRLLILHNLGGEVFVISLYISYWFCFSGEPTTVDVVELI